MWTYSQSSGQLLSPDGKPFATGYAGRGIGCNNPAAECIAKVGPIPRGTYVIGEPSDKHPHLGPLAMELIPAADNQMHGRGGFFLHGPHPNDQRSSSEGCIILDRASRMQIASSPDRELEVVA